MMNLKFKKECYCELKTLSDNFIYRVSSNGETGTRNKSCFQSSPDFSQKFFFFVIAKIKSKKGNWNKLVYLPINLTQFFVLNIFQK